MSIEQQEQTLKNAAEKEYLLHKARQMQDANRQTAAQATRYGNIGGLAEEAEAKCCDGNVGGELTKPLRILDSIARRRRRAAQSVESFQKLDELHGLLQRNPEVARIFELMEEVGR